MASKASAAIALLLSLNLLFFSMTDALITGTLTQCPGTDLNVCVNVLPFGILGGGLTQGSPCCALLGNLVAADAELCLCAMVKFQIFGFLSLNIDADLNVLLNSYCKIGTTKTYTCPLNY
ncbi:hypothetical protein F3Y22_tig00111942pilonHSYRG00010 [Hibiscus syriacus]|uniref:Hydrophobic seed protein domain-containing protein n=1 Tax=Hibiscus syriacus TaxID=106335 RepID=A0A6A2Y5W3_HIBSY|nr:putative lipid-binding protein AIR1 [Hibiscus syriacus]KAE8671546.1 hypothetical protein F3Y22_tig00111942pilonHSYRG00010 [Hibiscus syriacus]